MIIYEGPSVLDGAPIVCVLLLGSRNKKTGNMAQTYILRADISPLDAIRGGQDVSICGECPQRRYTGGACYVNVGHAPQSIWRKYKKGGHEKITPQKAAQLLNFSAVRLGSYGDPAAVPHDVWQPIVENAGARTGYTHQLTHKNFDNRLLGYCMASTENAAITKKLHADNVRTFRIIASDADTLPNEVICPSNKGIQCFECGLCNGSTNNKKSVAIPVHGTVKSRFLAQ